VVRGTAGRTFATYTSDSESDDMTDEPLSFSFFLVVVCCVGAPGTSRECDHPHEMTSSWHAANHERTPTH
jgi:hypothetical protein